MHLLGPGPVCLGLFLIIMYIVFLVLDSVTAYGSCSTPLVHLTNG